MIARKKKDAAAPKVSEAVYDVIVSPVVTEKSTAATEQNKIVFNVRLDAQKPQIKNAVEALFGVKVKSVNTLVREGKRKLFRGKPGKQNDMKKAIVTLENGQTIDFTAGVK